MKSNTRWALALVLVLFVMHLPTAFAGTDKWTSIGPFGGKVQALAIDPQNPDIAYAGTRTGMFKTTNGGISWSGMDSAIVALSFAIDPRTAGTVYAGGYGVFKSTDGGTNWTAPDSTWPSYSTGQYVRVNALPIDPQNPTTLYSATTVSGVHNR